MASRERGNCFILPVIATSTQGPLSVGWLGWGDLDLLSNLTCCHRVRSNMYWKILQDTDRLSFWIYPSLGSEIPKDFSIENISCSPQEADHTLLSIFRVLTISKEFCFLIVERVCLTENWLNNKRKINCNAKYEKWHMSCITAKMNSCACRQDHYKQHSLAGFTGLWVFPVHDLGLIK